MKCKTFLFKLLFSAIISLFFVVQFFAQARPRVVANETNATKPEIFRESKPTNASPKPIARPILTNEIRIIGTAPTPPLVKKTVSSMPVNSPVNASTTSSSMAAFNQRLRGEMQERLGIPYHYGSSGPNRYDCSGLVWSVFLAAGHDMTRTSAASFFRTFEPVYGDERYKFGTLVFFNGLGHVGIVVDQDTFYHASSSKGVTFSRFAGYWEKRIVGFRRIPLNF